MGRFLYSSDSISALLCKPYRLLYEQGMSRVTARSDPGSVLKGFSLQKLCRIMNIVARHPAHQTSRAVLLHGFQRFLSAPVRNDVSAHFYLVHVIAVSRLTIQNPLPNQQTAKLSYYETETHVTWPKTPSAQSPGHSDYRKLSNKMLIPVEAASDSLHLRYSESSLGG